MKNSPITHPHKSGMSLDFLQDQQKKKIKFEKWKGKKKKKKKKSQSQKSGIPPNYPQLTVITITNIANC